jgi:hypothetical protein
MLSFIGSHHKPPFLIFQGRVQRNDLIRKKEGKLGPGGVAIFASHFFEEGMSRNRAKQQNSAPFWKLTKAVSKAGLPSYESST